jgi:hypothetical protein
VPELKDRTTLIGGVKLPFWPTSRYNPLREPERYRARPFKQSESYRDKTAYLIVKVKTEIKYKMVSAPSS